jgi:integrase
MYVAAYSTNIRRIIGGAMAKTLIEAQLTTAKARSRLQLGGHWRRLDAEAHLGYRKGKQGGVWFTRWRNHHEGGNYKQAPLGAANDVNDRPVDGTLTFEQALRAARDHVARARTEAAAQAAGPAPTVRSAVQDYVKVRDARDTRRLGREVRSEASGTLGRYVIGQEKQGKRKAHDPTPLAAVHLHALRGQDLLTWREKLPQHLKITAQQRVMTDLKAALNAAFPKFSDEQKLLNPTFLAIVTESLKLETDFDDNEMSVARDNQILTDGQVSILIRSSGDIDAAEEWEGDLHRLVVGLGATGARYSQIRRMRVGDAQVKQRRLMMPNSYKGRGGTGGSEPIPVGDDVMEALLPAIVGRPADAWLFERWAYVQEPGGIEWKKSERGPWQRGQLTRPWHAIRDHADMPDVIPYALRHSSIVRGLKKLLPIQHVAKMHNTSVEMIERHYAKYISSALEELARAAIVPLILPEGGNVVKLGRT